MKYLRRIKKTAKVYNANMVIGLEFFMKAHQFVWENSLRKYLLMSGLTFLILFSITINLIFNGINASEHSVTIFITSKLTTYINLSVDEIQIGIKAFFWLLKNTIYSNKDSIFTFVFLIIGTPYFSIISRKVQEVINPNREIISINWWREIKRGLNLSIKNSIKQLGLLIVVTLISFIPIIGIISPLLIFIIHAYYNGILMMDYALERQDYSVKASQKYYSDNKPSLFAIGLGFMALLLVPVIGWFLAPTYALVASSLMLLSDKE